MLPAGEYKGRNVGNLHSSFFNHYSRGSRGCCLHCWSQCELAHQLNSDPNRCGDHHGSHCWSDLILHVSPISFDDHSAPLVWRSCQLYGPDAKSPPLFPRVTGHHMRYCIWLMTCRGPCIISEVPVQKTCNIYTCTRLRLKSVVQGKEDHRHFLVHLHHDWVAVSHCCW